jgi:ketosteroid isomerase-like protein
MSMSREVMDKAVDDHFAFEANDDVNGVVDSLLDEFEHEVIPSPFGKITDRAKIRAYYELLFADSQGERVTPIRRLYGDDFLVDETVWHGLIKDGRPFLCDGKSADVSVRILHIFGFRDGKISSEQAWIDLAAMQVQLGCTVS